MKKTFEIVVRGLVQGVGFRPFIYRIAMEHCLKVWVENRNDGVFSYAYLIPSNVPAGKRNLPVFVQDAGAQTDSDTISIEITAADTGDGDKGLLDEYLGLPGFEGNLMILAFILLFILLIGNRKNIMNKNRKS